MKPGSILEEVWRVKDQLAREAGFDTGRFVKNLHRWSEAHPATGPVFHTAAELRSYVAEQERQRVAVVRETPPPKEGKNT
jgi:hypothetical protein